MEEIQSFHDEIVEKSTNLIKLLSKEEMPNLLF